MEPILTGAAVAPPVNRAPGTRAAETVLPACIHLAGVDGTGKSTQARILADLLRRRHAHVRCVWLRFPRLLSAPLLVYARLRDLSWQETVGGSTHGYWDFGGSWVMAHVYPWLVWIDALIYAAVYVYTPRLLGRGVVCDRFVVDTLADLMAALEDDTFDLRLPGRLFPVLIPRTALVVVLDLDFVHAVQRNPELAGDRTWPLRRRMYQAIARHQGLRVISTKGAVEEVTEQILSGA